MQKGNLLKINLLPSEFLAAQKEYRKFHKIQLICIAIVLFLAFFASLTVSLRVFQTQKVSAAQSELEEYSTKVGSFKDKEAQLVILKNRLGIIEKLTSTPSKQRQMYNLINTLIPASIVVNSFNVDASGNANISLVAQEITSLQFLIDDLLSKEKNEGLVNKVEVENLSRGRDTSLRTGLRVVSN